MSWLIGIAIGVFIGTMIGVFIGALLAAAGESYTGPSPDRLP